MASTFRANFFLIDWVLDGGYLPQSIIRIGIRRQLRDRISQIGSTSLEEAYRSKMEYVHALRIRPIAIETATANEQHYEVGTGFLKGCLGPRMKYSSCLYSNPATTLAQAEIAMLELYVQRAELIDGMTILDLGCVATPFPVSLLGLLTDALKVWLGIWGPVFRGDLSKLKNRSFLELENAESTH